MDQETGATPVEEGFGIALPNRTSVWFSLTASEQELSPGLRRVLDAYYPRTFASPLEEARTLTEEYLKRMGELHSLTIVGYTAPAESDEAVILPTNRVMSFTSNMDTRGYYQAMQRIAELILWVLDAYEKTARA